jgi:hypothetical protein
MTKLAITEEELECLEWLHYQPPGTTLGEIIADALRSRDLALAEIEERRKAAGPHPETD